MGSITKQFTCAVALQLEQERKLSFDDRVAKYEPGLTRAADITVRRHRRHGLGLPRLLSARLRGPADGSAAAEPRHRRATSPRGRSTSSRARAIPTATPATCCSAPSPSVAGREPFARAARAPAVHAARPWSHALRAERAAGRHGRGLHAARPRRGRAGGAGRGRAGLAPPAACGRRPPTCWPGIWRSWTGRCCRRRRGSG